MPPPIEATLEEQIKMHLHDEESKLPDCKSFHKMVYSFIKKSDPQVDSLINFKRWLAGVALALLVIFASTYSKATDICYRLDAIEKKMAPLGIGASRAEPPTEGANPTVPDGWRVEPNRRTP